MDSNARAECLPAVLYIDYSDEDSSVGDLLECLPEVLHVGDLLECPPEDLHVGDLLENPPEVLHEGYYAEGLPEVLEEAEVLPGCLPEGLDTDDYSDGLNVERKERNIPPSALNNEQHTQGC